MFSSSKNVHPSYDVITKGPIMGVTCQSFLSIYRTPKAAPPWLSTICFGNDCFLQPFVVKNVFSVYLRCLFWWVKVKRNCLVLIYGNEKQMHKIGTLREKCISQIAHSDIVGPSYLFLLSRSSVRRCWMPLQRFKQPKKLLSNSRTSCEYMWKIHRVKPCQIKVRPQTEGY